MESNERAQIRIAKFLQTLHLHHWTPHHSRQKHFTLLSPVCFWRSSAPSYSFFFCLSFQRQEHLSKSSLQMIWLALATFRFTVKNRLETPQHLVNLFEKDSVPPKRGWLWWKDLGNGSYETRTELAKKRKTKSKGGLEEEVLRRKKNSNWCSLVIENRAGNQRLKLQTRG